MAHQKCKGKIRKNLKRKSKGKLPECPRVSAIGMVVSADAWFCLGRLQSIVDRETELLSQGEVCGSESDLQEARAILVAAWQLIRSQPATAKEMLSRGLSLWQS